MNFAEIINGLIDNTLQVSIPCFGPELALCGTVVALLLARLFNIDKLLPAYWIALFGSLAAFVLVYVQFWNFQEFESSQTELFTGLLVFDKFAVFFRLFLLLFLVFVIVLTVLSGIPDREDGPDFYTLLIGSTIGMALMASANHLLILFLGIEMTSVPSYVMVGFLKGRRPSSEAALKYVIYGAGAAGVMLYGISLIAGLLGTGNLDEIAVQASRLLEGSAGVSSAAARTLVLAIMMMLVGIAFKLSVFPFHFWCPDAFEGAAAEVGGFLSVASKAAAFALLVRFCLAFAGGDPSSLAGVNSMLGIGLGVLAAVTATFGNLAAYSQTNIKRLLAYSTIAHAGYMLMGVAALVVIRSAPAASGWSAEQIGAGAADALEGLLYYLAVYLFMNLGAFAIVALIRNQIFSEEIDDYAGIGKQIPLLGVCMGICLFSLVGIPPLAGFTGKFMIFASLFNAGSLHWFMWVVLVIGGLNTVFSLFYYLRVLKVMFIDPRPSTARVADIPPVSAPALYVVLVTAPVFLLFVFVNQLSQTAQNVATLLIR